MKKEDKAMKELSIEQKAKAYDEALKKAKDMLSYKEVRREDMEYLFPELVESEDEEIRKFLIQMAQNGHGEDRDWWNKCVDWLEKQGEQKPAEWSKEDEKDFDTVYGIIYNSCNAEDASRLIEWLKSLKDRVQPQPKNEWSEEDRIIRNALIKLVEKLYDSSIYELDKNRLLDWLKSIRPQNRCTYNPYKEVVESIAEMCEKYEDANLDSLKDFYSNVKVKCKDAKEYDSLFPQSTWKPSDEQLDSLYDVLNPCDGLNRDVLESLYNDLKKLRED